MPSFDRFDICEAYLALEIGWNVGGVLHERPRNKTGRRLMSVGFQLNRMRFQAGHGFRGFESLTDNGKEIYAEACERFGFDDPDVEAWRAQG